jgi:PAS domain S-box-containing protein
LVETTGTGYVILDLAGRVLDANPEYVRMTGHRDLAEITGRSVLEWTAPQDREHNGQAVAHCATTGTIRGFVTRYLAGDGGLTPIELSATVVGQGEDRRILTLCRDISARLQAEEAARNAQRLESLSILAGGIAHDFNNLLAGLFGHLELAQNEVEPGSPARHRLGQALAAYHRARALTLQLLTFAKGGAPVKEIVTLPAVLRQSLALSLSGSSISAHLDLPEELWPCEADRNQLGQVLDNILINARQAMPLGGTVDIQARNLAESAPLPPDLEPGDYVAVTIRDQGVGIPREILPRIFDPFFTTKQDGSGLGLATSFSIIKKHGGTLTAASGDGQGAAFTLYLPASHRPGTAPEAAPACRAQQRKGRALLMDDEESIRSIAGTYLRMAGFDVALAEEGTQAVELYRQALAAGRRFDVVLLDLTVPGGMGGKEAIARLRELDPAVQAIASSGYSDDPIMADPARFGFCARLVKPYLREDLHRALGSLAEDPD